MAEHSRHRNLKRRALLGGDAEANPADEASAVSLWIDDRAKCSSPASQCSSPHSATPSRAVAGGPRANWVEHLQDHVVERDRSQAALLKQNPRFEAGMSGPLAGLFGALLSQMSAGNEYSVFIDDAKRRRILSGLFDDFYADSSAEVIFDTNRAWCASMPAIAALFPEARVIACVRDLPWVIDSIERLVQRNVFSPSSIFNYSAGGTVYTRANAVAGQDGMVGGPYDALKQASYGAQRDRLLLVQYETLTADPARTMRAIYDFLGETSFQHDFDQIDYDVTEFDDRAGTPGLHTVGASVRAEPRATLLPPDLFERFVNDAFWRDPERRPDGLHIV